MCITRYWGSQWPRGLRLGSAAARLVGLLVSNSAGMDACVFECCVFSGEDLCVGLDHSARVVPSSVVCLSVIVKP